MSKSIVRGFVIDVRLWALPFYVRSQKPALLRCKRFHLETLCGSFHTRVDIGRGQSTSCLPSHQVTWLATYVVGVWDRHTKMVRDRWNFGCPMEIFMRDNGNGFLCCGNVSANGVWYVNRREPDEVSQPELDNVWRATIFWTSRYVISRLRHGVDEVVALLGFYAA
jgi:hypothetical protein